METLADGKKVAETLPKVHVYKRKERHAVVERKLDDYSCVCRGLFKKETNPEKFIGLSVYLSSGDTGFIDGMFGQSGKFKIYVRGKYSCGSFLIF